MVGGPTACAMRRVTAKDEIGMSVKTIHLVAGARPNFMKIAPVYRHLAMQAWCRPVIVHTGQHYDPNMSDQFFSDLGLPAPHHNLAVGSGSHATQTAAIMVAYEKLCLKEKPDWVVVVGDVNSTMACAITAKKLCLPVAHLEAGLRSCDRTMPEEINRLVTDAISDLLWTPSSDADDNLRREGVAEGKIERVGNVMIDSLEMLRGAIESSDLPASVLSHGAEYGVVTLHRPANVDAEGSLARLMDLLGGISNRMPLVFPVHPRTEAALQRFGLWEKARAHTRLHMISPMGYVQFMSLVFRARLVITDSGGIQEETTYLGIPCLTMRDTTERPITVTVGTNRLVRMDELVAGVERVLSGAWPQGRRPDLWDGHAADRIGASLQRNIIQRNKA